ncbi:MAG: B12-binding domain-containing radical SAM protein [Deltaproteobacteria bacterium]|nr:B12-binding domain-containing radical SAM protein [Deltaproteobacteria bacterium]
MDYILINPLRALLDFYYIPTGLLSLHTAAQKNGYTGKIIDFNTIIFHDNISDYQQIVESEIQKAMQAAPELKVVGVSILFSAVVGRSLNLIRTIRNLCPNVKIVVGGIHATLHSQEMMTHINEIDYVVIGEGESTFVDVLDHVYGTKVSSDLKNGIAFRNQGELVIHSVNRYIQSLDEINMVDYSSINLIDYIPADIDKWYSTKKVLPGPIAPILTSRACPYQCTFCSMYRVMGRKFRARTACSVLNEIKFLHYEKGVNYFHIYDDNFSLRRDRALEILKGIVADGMKIALSFPNGLAIKHLDEEMIDYLAQAGASYVYLAIESGSEYIRNSVIRKKLSEAQIYKVVNYFSDNYPEIRLSAFFIIGFPEDTQKTLGETRDMLLQMDKVIGEVFNCVPYYGTALWDQCIKDDLLTFDHRDAWRKSYTLGTNTSQWYSDSTDTLDKEFYLKPYQLSLDELQEYRVFFDALYAQRSRAFSEKYRK